LFISVLGLTAVAAVSLAWALKGDPAQGKVIFEQCQICHDGSTVETKIGPGLKGLFKKEKMPSGKKTSNANVMEKINQGGKQMPPHMNVLTDHEKENLLAYLMTL